MLNPQSPIPLYHQLADILTGQIREGRYRPGDTIPSETGMAKEYGIGRPTVRQAMDTLVRKGLIERRRGSGTYVKEPETRVDIFSLAGTSQAFSTRGITTETKMIDPVSLKPIQDDPDNPFDNGPAFYFSRLTSVDGSPVLIEDMFFHPELFSGLDRMDLDNQSLAAVVADQYYMKPEKGHQVFVLATLEPERAGLLDLGPETPVLEVRRTLDFPENPGAVYSRLFCRTDRFAFSQTIMPAANI